MFQDTKAGEEVVAVTPSFTVTQLVQCEMPHACKFRDFFFSEKDIKLL